MHFDGDETARMRGRLLTATKSQMSSHLMPYQRVDEGRRDVRWEFCVIVFVSPVSFCLEDQPRCPLKRRGVEASNCWWLKLDKLR